MKQGRKILSLALGIAMAVCGCVACGEETKENVLKTKVYAGASVDLTPSIYQQYLRLGDEADVAAMLYGQYRSGATVAVPTAKEMTLSWDRTVGASGYTYRVSTTEDMHNIVCFERTQEAYGIVPNLLPGTYYWQVADSLGNESTVDCFVISDYVRALNVDGIRNFRDMGGWKTEDGKTIAYGLTYRSAQLKESSGKALAELGVRTEVDLRAESAYAESVIPKSYGIQFLQAGIMQSDYVLQDKSFYASLTPEQIEEKRHKEAAFKQEYADALYAAFKLYTDAENYPILFHCTSGADRTGTFAFLLAGMLGVEIDDLYRDFELTCFSMGGRRWRSNIVGDGNGGYRFNDDGYVTVPDNYVAIGLLYKGLMECYSTGDGKLSSAIKNYLKKDVGLTDADFDAIARILLR